MFLINVLGVRVIAFALALVVPMAFGSFGVRVWDVPIEDFQRNLQHQPNFLQDIDTSTVNIADIDRLGAGASYLVGLVLEELGQQEDSHRLLRYAWNNTVDPWRYRAGLELLAYYSTEEQYGEQQILAQQGVDHYPNDERYLRYYLEAVYWNGEYDTLFKYLPRYRSAIKYENGYPLRTMREKLSEAMLWEAVSEYRHGLHTRAGLFARHYATFSASNHHSRMYEFIIDEPELLEVFSERQLLLFKIKHQIHQQSYRAAAENLEKLFDANTMVDLRHIMTDRTVRDFGRAYFYGGYTAAGATRFGELALTIPLENQPTTYEWLGHLLAKQGKVLASETAYLHAFRLSGSDYYLRLTLSSAFERSHKKGIQILDSYGNKITNKGYFNRVIESVSSRYLRDKEFDKLWDLRDRVNKYGSDYARARFAVIMATAVRANLAQPPAGVTHNNIYEDLEFARAQNDSSHYSYLAAKMLGKTAVISYRRNGVPNNSNAKYSKVDCIRLINGYVAYRLSTRILPAVRDCENHLDFDQLVKLSRQLNQVGIYDVALRIADRTRYRPDFVFEERTIKLLYPRAYQEFIDYYAERNSIPQYFFYALIREESYFKSSVSSHAGAIGLGQFIPSTARAVAARMQIPVPDLTDPESNLMLSSYHIRELLDILENKPLFALAAYNAGQSRAHRWRELHDSYPFVLLHESIPFQETRHYVRKIMVSHIRYASLYSDIPATAVISRYYPDLQLFR